MNLWATGWSITQNKTKRKKNDKVLTKIQKRQTNDKVLTKDKHTTKRQHKQTTKCRRKGKKNAKVLTKRQKTKKTTKSSTSCIRAAVTEGWTPVAIALLPGTITCWRSRLKGDILFFCVFWMVLKHVDVGRMKDFKANTCKDLDLACACLRSSCHYLVQLLLLLQLLQLILLACPWRRWLPQASPHHLLAQPSWTTYSTYLQLCEFANLKETTICNVLGTTRKPCWSAWMSWPGRTVTPNTDTGTSHSTGAT